MSTFSKTGCGVCVRELSMTLPRQNEDHYAVRFGDVMVKVFLNGEQLNDITEVQCGPGGWALRASMKHDKPQVCHCGEYVKEWRTVGRDHDFKRYLQFDDNFTVERHVDA